MFHKFFEKMGKRLNGRNCGQRCHRGRHCGGWGCRRALNDVEENQRCLVVRNEDKKTLELGAFNGSGITVLSNDPKQNNIVVGIGDGRFSIPRETAAKILVK